MFRIDLCFCVSYVVLGFETKQRHWIGLVVRTSAFRPEGRRFESMKGYTPD